MDARKLETTRDTALRHVQRCTPSCPSSTSCRYGHERSLLRFREPCTPEVLRDRRFVLEVERRREDAAAIYMFDLIGAANDAVLFELLLDRRTWCQADSRALVEEANLAEQPGPDGCRSRPGVATTDFRPEVGVLMRLMRRKNKLIDKCRAFRQAATDASSPDHLSGTATPKRGCVNACASLSLACLRAGTSASAARPIPIHQTQTRTPKRGQKRRLITHVKLV